MSSHAAKCAKKWHMRVLMNVSELENLNFYQSYKQHSKSSR